MSEPILKISQLTARVEEKEILHDINFEMRKGETHVLMGPNGAGKSTLGYVLMGNPKYEVTGGSISFKGKDITVEGINAAMKAASNESYGYNEDEIVSSDIVGMRYGSLFDATQTMVSKVDEDTYEVQVVSWYDNENSYTSQMVRTIKHFGTLL